LGLKEGPRPLSFVVYYLTNKSPPWERWRPLTLQWMRRPTTSQPTWYCGLGSPFKSVKLLERGIYIESTDLSCYILGLLIVFGRKIFNSIIRLNGLFFTWSFTNSTLGFNFFSFVFRLLVDFIHAEGYTPHPVCLLTHRNRARVTTNCPLGFIYLLNIYHSMIQLLKDGEPPPEDHIKRRWSSRLFVESEFLAKNFWREKFKRTSVSVVLRGFPWVCPDD
jgi:hypothetical protein